MNETTSAICDGKDDDEDDLEEENDTNHAANETHFFAMSIGSDPDVKKTQGAKTL